MSWLTLGRELELADAAEDLERARWLAGQAYDQGFDDLREACGHVMDRITRATSAAMQAADYPPAPVGDSWRCWACWYYHQRRVWMYQRDSFQGKATAASVQISDDSEPGGVRVIDQVG